MARPRQTAGAGAGGVRDLRRRIAAAARAGLKVIAALGRCVRAVRGGEIAQAAGVGRRR